MSVTDYLRFSANSMKELIKQKLNETGNFTDQNFEDSNISTFIDISSYMYTVLMYYLNNSASESMFTDTQIYENMNRLVKMLGYNPQGFVTSSVLCKMGIRDTYSFNTTGIKTIPKYTTYTTSLKDSNGNSIRYSFADNYPFVVSTLTSIDTDFTPTLYNGYWKLYNNTFTTTGIPYETFTLDSLSLIGATRTYLAHNKIDVYVKLPNGTFESYTPVTNLYNSTSNDKNFEVRLNENYQYTLKFGDGITGKRLTAGSTVFVVYLESNGPDGEIGASVLDGSNELSVMIDGLTETFIKTNILKISENPQYITFGSDSTPELPAVKITNENASTYVKDFESVEDIRLNAPTSFRIGSRLITEQDFKQYILANYPSEIYDVKVMNNWEYMTDFQQWLKTYNKLSSDIRYYSYKYSDACDFNNVYIWLKSFGNENVTQSTKTIITRDCNRLKPLTSELTPLDPFILNIIPYLSGAYDFTNFDPNNENMIQIIRDKNTMITAERIKQRAITVIQDFFSITNNSLGITIDINNLYNQLLSIDGVKSVRTRYLVSGNPESTAQYFDGLSFAVWTQHIIQGGDFVRISGNYAVKSFQFPSLYDSDNIGNKIEILSDIYNIAEAEY